MIFGNHLRYAAIIIKEYDGSVPLAVYLKAFFQSNKQMGSRDRKTVAELIYSYFRLGHLQFASVEERIQAGIDKAVSADGIFPWKHLLSEGIDATTFEQSFLQQPDLFIRIRPGNEKSVLQKLDDNRISYRQLSSSCLALPNTTKTDTILSIDKEAVIQDYSSQRVEEFLRDVPGLFRTTSVGDRIVADRNTNLQVWDCCAASGGKSILAYDLLRPIDLTVSDIRPSILHNLKERFTRAGIKSYKSFIADLSAINYELPPDQYDLVIADVPCSGSGTWARTPEQLYFFKEEKIDYYAALQCAIVSKIIPALKPGGVLLYITCSVFKQENEEAVEFIKNSLGLHLDKMELLKGYSQQADSMFVARFVN